MILLAQKVQFGTSPNMYFDFYYEKKRDGADMLYRTKTVLYPLEYSTSYYGYYINQKLLMDDVQQESVNIKENSPSHWDSNIEYTSPWYRVSNKTSGTTSVTFDMYGGGGRPKTYNYTMAIDPAYATCNQSLGSITETYAIINWSSDSTIDYVWYSLDNGSTWKAVGSVNGKSGTYVVDNLNPNTSYTVKTRVRRKDSQLTTDFSGVHGFTTYDYPYCNSMPDFTIGNTLVIKLYNPLARKVDVYFVGDNGSEILSAGEHTGDTVQGFTNSTFLNFFYSSLPNKRKGTYKIRVVYGNSNITKTGGTYFVNQNNCTPTVTSMSLIDINSSTIKLTAGSSATSSNHIVKGRSTGEVAITFKTINYATVGTVTIGGTAVTPTLVSSSGGTYTYTATRKIYNISSKTVDIYITDGREYPSGTTSVSASGNLIDYVPLTCSAIFKRISQTSDVITIEVSGNYFNGSFGAVNNTLSMSWYYRQKGTTSWNYGGDIAPTISGNKYNASASAGGGYNYRTDYEFILYYVDKLNDLNTGIILVSKGIGSLEVYEDGIKLNGDFLSRIGFATDHLYHDVPDVGNIAHLSAPDSSITLDCNFQNYDLLLIRFGGRVWGWLQKYEVIMVDGGIGYDYFSTSNLFCTTMQVYNAPEYPMAMQYYITNNNKITILANTHYTGDNHLYIKDIYGVKFKN